MREGAFGAPAVVAGVHKDFCDVDNIGWIRPLLAVQRFEGVFLMAEIGLICSNTYWISGKKAGIQNEEAAMV